MSEAADQEAAVDLLMLIAGVILLVAVVDEIRAQ
jgi:hypothetical protein